MMKLEGHNIHFTLFGLADDTKLYVAVPDEYLTFIKQAEKEYGSLVEVPPDKTIRGIFVKNTSETFDENAPQNDIAIKSLLKN